MSMDIMEFFRVMNFPTIIGACTVCWLFCGTSLKMKLEVERLKRQLKEISSKNDDELKPIQTRLSRVEGIIYRKDI